jgi:hypothetical protein
VATTQKTTRPTKPNPFDDIARQVIADQAAKDRAAGRDDLTPALAKSVDQARTKRAATKPAKPSRPTKTAEGGRRTAKKPTKPASEWLTGITLQRPWAERKPDYLKGRTLVIRYQVKVDGTVWSTLTQLREADGSLVPNFKDYPLDYRPTQERDGRNRPVILKGDLEGPALQEWLRKQGLASP